MLYKCIIHSFIHIAEWFYRSLDLALWGNIELLLYFRKEIITSDDSWHSLKTPLHSVLHMKDSNHKRHYHILPQWKPFETLHLTHANNQHIESWFWQVVKVNALNRSNTHSGTEQFTERYLTLVYCRSRPPWVFCHRPGVNIMDPSRKYFSVWQASAVKHSNKIWVQLPKQMDFTHYSSNIIIRHPQAIYSGIKKWSRTRSTAHVLLLSLTKVIHTIK